MKRAKVRDGKYELPCGASVSLRDGRSLDVFFGPAAPTPERSVVQQEVELAIGLPVWLVSWPDQSVLPHGVEWPGIARDAVVLDYDERIRESADLLTVGALLAEIVELQLHRDVGWEALGVDPARLPSFGGERPDVPAAFFWRWEAHDAHAQAGLPAMPLSWDHDHVLVAADPEHGPFRVPRGPSKMFATDLARRCSLRGCTDEEAFRVLATTLPWADSYEMIGSSGLYFVSTRDRVGERGSDACELGVVIRETSAPIIQRARDVIAVATSEALRDPDIVGVLATW